MLHGFTSSDLRVSLNAYLQEPISPELHFPEEWKDELGRDCPSIFSVSTVPLREAREGREEGSLSLGRGSRHFRRKTCQGQLGLRSLATKTVACNPRNCFLAPGVCMCRVLSPSHVAVWRHLSPAMGIWMILYLNEDLKFQVKDFINQADIFPPFSPSF